MGTLFTEDDNCLVVTPTSRLDTNTSPEFAEIITTKVKAGQIKVIIDFTQTDYISSAGLRVILVTAKLLQPINGKFALCNANDQIIEVLEISGFNSIVKSFDNLEAAKAFIGE